MKPIDKQYKYVMTVPGGDDWVFINPTNSELNIMIEEAKKNDYKIDRYELFKVIIKSHYDKATGRFMPSDEV